VTPTGPLERGIAYLVRGQGRTGGFADFWLPVGASDAWVTAYVGLALHEAAQSADLSGPWRRAAGCCARRSAQWLRRQPRPMRGWGYNGNVPPDADSTAHAISLLARTGLQVPPDALAFMREHEVPGRGFLTYRYRHPAHPWRALAPDVTAAVLRALADAGELKAGELARAWVRLLGGAQDERGWWSSLWWPTPSYPTGLVLEVWAAAGRPGLQRPVDGNFPETSAFDAAWARRAQRALRREKVPVLRRLVGAQAADGGWSAAGILRVPSPGGDTCAAERTLIGRDDRRLFTTATAVTSLCADRPREYAAAVGRSDDRRPPGVRSPLGAHLDAQVVRAARVLGLSHGCADDARALFASLTARSLAPPCPWPSQQLSSLAGGSPIEFSVRLGEGSKPALRYAAEIGSPLSAPYRRAVRGLGDLAVVAGALGYSDGWERARRGVRTLVSPAWTVPDYLRFWVWTGVQHTEDAPPVLKIYVNLLHGEAGPARGRLETALAAAGIPPSSARARIFDRLDGAGFPQELGFGLGGGGTFGCKVYYELPGWRRFLVEQLLVLAGLPADGDALCPRIAGVLRESLAARQKSGVALRLDVDDGEVVEVTMAAPFPLPLIGHRETADRVAAWIKSLGWDVSPYRALSGMLLEDWEAQERAPGQLHSLFTRTLSAGGSSAAVYLRPCLPMRG